MTNEKIAVEVSCRVDSSMTHVFMFKIPDALWNGLEDYEKADWMRRKLWNRLKCEYKVSEDQA